LSYITDIASQVRDEVSPDLLPNEDTNLLFLFYAVLALEERDDIRLEDVHNAWAAWMTYRDPSHESIRPYNQLDSKVKHEDQPFLDAIRKVASRLD
jgi:hypothetical protein